MASAIALAAITARGRPGSTDRAPQLRHTRLAVDHRPAPAGTTSPFPIGAPPCRQRRIHQALPGRKPYRPRQGPRKFTDPARFRTSRRAGGCEMASDHPRLTMRRVRRGPDAWVLAASGELSQQSAGLVSGAVTAALANSGRVLVDVSGLRVTWPPAVGLFGSILAGMGGWPGMRLVLFGADAKLARSLAALRVSASGPVPPDETPARQLLDRRPRVLARHLDLKQPRS